MNEWFNFINNVDSSIVINKTRTNIYNRPTVGRSSAKWRPISGVWCQRLFDQMPKSWCKIYSKSKPTVGRSSGGHRPTLHRRQNSWKSANRSTKLLTWLLREKRRRPTKIISQNRCQCWPTIDQPRPIFQTFPHRPSADRRCG